MERTTLTIDDETRERLNDHVAPGHNSLNEALSGIMEILPTVEDIESGCTNTDCDRDRLIEGKPEHTGGVIHFFHHEFEGDDVYGSAYFCSPECAAETQEKVDQQVPQNPDKVVVGGKDELRAEFKDASFYLDGQTREVGIPVPGAFGSGTSSHGYEYDYIGEPVYIYNADQWVQSGVIEEVIHEEIHTALLLDRNLTVEHLHHPDEEIREEKLETYSHWYSMTCPECGEEVRANEDMDDEVQCGHCEAQIERDPVPTEDIPETVRKHRAE